MNQESRTDKERGENPNKIKQEIAKHKNQYKNKTQWHNQIKIMGKNARFERKKNVHKIKRGIKYQYI